MFDTMKEAAKIGMGAIWLSKENLKKMSDELARLGKMSEEEGDRLFKEFEQNSQEYREKLNSHVETLIGKTLDKAGFAPKSDLESMQKKIEELEAKLAKLDGQAE